MANVAASSRPFRVCASCARPESENLKLLKCGRCYSVVYCSRECQRVGFSTHRESCARLFADYQTAQQLAAKNPSLEKNMRLHRNLVRVGEAAALQDRLSTPATLAQLLAHSGANREAMNRFAATLPDDIKEDWARRQRERLRQTPEQCLQSLSRMRDDLLGETEENLARLPPNVLESEKKLLRDMRLRLNSGDANNNLEDAIRADSQILNTVMLRILETSSTP